MNKIQRYHIYVLLCAVILADRRVRDIEIETFVSLVSGFQVALDDPEPDSDAEIRHWFDNNQHDIAKWLGQDQWHSNLNRHLEGLRSFDYKWQLLQAMRSIAISDKELHEAEVTILKYSVDFWGENFDLGLK